jgi:hypothetical protein
MVATDFVCSGSIGLAENENKNEKGTWIPLIKNLRGG